MTPDEPHWTEPGAWPVAPGVHRIPLPLPMDGLRAVNVYAIETDAGLTLVDGGWAIEVARTQLEESLRRIGYRPHDITSFLVTHAHRDHYTQAVALRSELGRATVALGSRERQILDLFRDDTTFEEPSIARLERAGAFDLAEVWRQGFKAEKFDFSVWAAPDTWLEGDVDVAVGGRTLQAIATPGHTQGHYVFADHAAGLLFAGDHVLPTITPSVGYGAGEALHLGEYLASLAKVRALPDLRLLPAHGAVTGSVHARVDELLAHHDHRLRLCVDAVASGASTSLDVARLLPWTRHDRSYTELDVFNSAMAVLETLVHLDLLVHQGRLARTTVDGVHLHTLVGD